MRRKAWGDTQDPQGQMVILIIENKKNKLKNQQIENKKGGLKCRNFKQTGWICHPHINIEDYNCSNNIL